MKVPLPPLQTLRLLTALHALAALLPTARAQLNVTDGLMLWLRGDMGVATNLDGTVSDWADSSPNLNDSAQPARGAAGQRQPVLPGQTLSAARGGVRN